jgi:hypothetical protein
LRFVDVAGVNPLILTFAIEVAKMEFAELLSIWKALWRVQA